MYLITTFYINTHMNVTQTYHNAVHYYNLWNDYAFLIPFISVIIVILLALWCCICPIYRCFVQPCVTCFYRCMGYKRLPEHH